MLVRRLEFYIQNQHVFFKKSDEVVQRVTGLGRRKQEDPRVSGMSISCFMRSVPVRNLASKTVNKQLGNDTQGWPLTLLACTAYTHALCTHIYLNTTFI